MEAIEIFKLFGSIFIDSSEAENSISKTTKQADGLGSKLASGIKTAAKWGTAIIGAATAVGGAMVAAAKDTASTLDTIDKASQRMGLSAESFQELNYAAGLSGVSMEQLERAAKKLEGTDINLDQALDQIMQLATEEERSAAATEMFGATVAYNLEPLLKVGAEGMAQMRQEANDLGLVMSQETVTSGAEMGDMFDKVSQSLATLKTSLVAELMPYVQQILEWVVENIPKIKETINNLMNGIMPIIKPILDGVMSFVEGFFALLNGDASKFADGIKNLLVGLAKGVYTLAKNIMTALWNGFKDVWASIKSWVSEKVNWLADKLMFWKKGQNQMSGADGVHASGLNYVPYDNYKAVLHKGETILNPNESKSMVADIVNAITPFMNGGGEQTINLVVDGETLASVLYKPLQEVTKGRNVAYG